MNPGVDVYTKNRNNKKTLHKTQKNNILKTKAILDTKIEATCDPVFIFNLAGRNGSHPCPCQLCHWPWGDIKLKEDA